MRVTVLTGILLLATPAYAANMSEECDVHTCYATLPDAMMGSWGMGDEEGIMDRAGPDEGDFYVAKDKYNGVDDTCTILHVEKLSENVYTVQARCIYSGGSDPPGPDDPPARIETDEFELKGCFASEFMST